MLEKIKNNYIYLISFIFFLIILSLAPICGDDWGNYPVGAQGLRMILSAAKGMYFSWEGRFVSRIIIYLFTYYKFLFVIVTSGLLTLIVFIANKVIGKVKNKVIYIMPFIFLLLLNVNSISQTYTWIAGSVTYLYPASIVLAYFYYLYQKQEFKFGKLEYVILLFINVITPMFVENIGLAFVFGNILWLILHRKEDKKELIKFSILSIISIAALVLMLVSPGTANRVDTEADFYNMNIFERMFSNIPYLIGYAITKNIIVLIMMSLAILLAFKKKNVKLRYIVLFFIIPIFGVIQNLYLMFPFDFNGIDANKLASMCGIFGVDNWYFIFYWILFVVLFFYSIIYLVQDDKEKIFLIFLTLVGGVAIGSMLVSPTWGERTAILSEFIFLIVSLRLIKDNFNLNKSVYVFLILIIIYFIVMFVLIFIMQKDRDVYIEKQLKDKNIDTIEVYDQFIYYIWTRGPWGEYHTKVFKKYYVIPEDKNVKIVDHKFEKFLYDVF